MKTDEHNTEDALRERLTAYLDGELGEQEQSQVEELLARDENARLELRQLERVWDALDQLPRAELDTRFAQTTVELVAVAAEEDVKALRDSEPRRRRRMTLLLGASFVTALLVGYGLVGTLADRRDDRLARDLPLLEDLDAYRQMQDFEFLELLQAGHLFSDPEGSHGR
jgi:anti-sigma factor RsiW